MSWPPGFLARNRLLSGPDRKVLREAILEGTDRARLRMALSDASPSRDYDDIVREAGYELEIDQLIGTALEQGWIRDLVAIVKAMTARADLLAALDMVNGRLALALRAGDVSSGQKRRMLPRVMFGAAVLLVLLLVALLLLFRKTDPNYIVRLQQGANPVSARPVFVTEIVADARDARRYSTVTNAHGEAFFSLKLGSNQIYMFGVMMGEASECTFPAFTVIQKREALYRLDSNSCLQVSGDVLLRTAPPEQPSNIRQIIPTLPTAPETRHARAPLGLPNAPVVLDRLFYTLGFDPSIRSPRWVSFTVDTPNSFRLPRALDKFTFDPAMPQQWQTGEEVYRGNSYDRGTLVRRSDAAIGTSPEAARRSEAEIFYYSVTVPQPAATNQRTWLGVENYTTNLSSQIGAIHVIAGPIYPDLGKDNGAYLTLGDSRTVVPSAMFRVLLRKAPNGAWRAIAFLVPNDGSIQREPRVFATTVAEVEKNTGLSFFTGLPASEAAALKGNASLAEFER